MRSYLSVEVPQRSFVGFACSAPLKLESDFSAIRLSGGRTAPTYESVL